MVETRARGHGVRDCNCLVELLDLTVGKKLHDVLKPEDEEEVGNLLADAELALRSIPRKRLPARGRERSSEVKTLFSTIDPDTEEAKLARTSASAISTP